MKCTAIGFSITILLVFPVGVAGAQEQSTAGIPAVPTAAALPGQAEEQAGEENPDDIRVFWRDGLRMETNDGRFQLRLGGRLMYDWLVWGDDAEVADAVAGPLLDGTEIRRARIYVSGFVYDRIEYKLQVDFAGGEVAFKDLYFGIRNDTLGVRFGHFKEPFSFETLTSSKYISFVERALISSFDAERNSGFMLHGSVVGDAFNYGIGVFRETDDGGTGIDRGRYNVTGRLAGALRNENDGRQVVHIGGAFTLKNADETELDLRIRPENHLAPRFISSGPFVTDGLDFVGLEALVIAGPFSAQAEWKLGAASAPQAGDPTFDGFYVFASYFLTGEHRAYDPGGMERLRPNRNLFENGGLGAWEVLARYSMIDLGAAGIDKTGSSIPGTRLDDVTLGVNWYWNPMTLMRFNVIHADIDQVGGVWAFLWRGQLEF